MARKGADGAQVPENKLVFETTGILSLSLGAILLVALAAGPSGAITFWLITGLRVGFGLGALAFPFAMMLLGVLLLTRFDDAVRFRPATVAIPVVFIAILAAIHLSVPVAERFDYAQLEARGGVVGASVGAVLMACFGLTGAYIIVVAAGLVALAISTQGPVAALAAPLGAAGRRLKARFLAWWAVKAEERRRRRVARMTGNGEPKTRRVRKPKDARPEPTEQPPEDEDDAPEEEPDDGIPPVMVPEWLLPKSVGQNGAASPDTLPGCMLNDDGQVVMGLDVPTRPKRKKASYKRPPMDKLDSPPPYDHEAHTVEAQDTIRLLEDALASYSIGAKVVSIERGPSVTRYEIEAEKGTRGASVSKLADDLARALAAIDVRVEPHVPGKSVIGIEVPNRTVALVTLREILASDEFKGCNSPLAFALGKDISGNCVIGDLTRMPHLLVAGATNSGKSVCLNGLILSILMRSGPDEVKFMMIDPKRVELALYDAIPHLISPVVYDAKEAAGLLRQAIAEMEERYRILADAGVRNIGEYNIRADKIGEEKLFYLVIVVDELADLMMQAAAEFEYSICRIAQLARAVGIHLIVATQRPSVNVVTGTIKANIPSRVAFAVSSQTDSRVILDFVGAERLIGRGDMLYLPIDASKPRRIQGAYTSVDEITRVVDFLHAHGEPEFLMEPVPIDMDGKGHYTAPSGDVPDDDGELMTRIVEFVCTQKQISTSMLQRKFRIGYNRAARITDDLEDRGLIGPADGAKPRKVLPAMVGASIAAEDTADMAPDDEDY